MSAHDPLLFIDTNIFLDFYRATGSADFKLLNRLKGVKNSLVTSHQVEMEFQKHRHSGISEAFGKLKLTRPEMPGLFVGTEDLKKFNVAFDDVEKNLKILRSLLTAAIKNPIATDPVYKAARDVFSFGSPFNLTRIKPEYNRILRHARRRFLLGYPPRKEKDTSMGDAVNWEWIVECAITSKRPVIIVSRDGDYGFSFDKVHHLNEWLFQEFIERVGNNNIKLTDSLSTALKEAKVPVTKAEQKAEEELILGAPPGSYLASLGNLKKEDWDEMHKLFVHAFPAFTSVESVAKTKPRKAKKKKSKK
jgi:hypothetical protein